MEEYKIEEIILDLGSQTYTLFQITNIDEVFDAMLSLPADNVIKHDERIPYWTEIWPSAIALSRFIGDHPDLIQDKRPLNWEQAWACLHWWQPALQSSWSAVIIWKMRWSLPKKRSSQWHPPHTVCLYRLA